MTNKNKDKSLAPTTGQNEKTGIKILTKEEIERNLLGLIPKDFKTHPTKIKCSFCGKKIKKTIGTH